MLLCFCECRCALLNGQFTSSLDASDVSHVDCWCPVNVGKEHRDHAPDRKICSNMADDGLGFVWIVQCERMCSCPIYRPLYVCVKVSCIHQAIACNV